MKLNRKFIAHTVAGEHVMVSANTRQFPGMVRNNKTAAFIVECLRKETSLTEIAEKVCAHYDVDYETAEKDAAELIEKLRGIGAIDD